LPISRSVTKEHKDRPMLLRPPNQALEPTTLAVMIPAAQEVTPAKVVAHL